MSYIHILKVIITYINRLSLFQNQSRSISAKIVPNSFVLPPCSIIFLCISDCHGNVCKCWRAKCAQIVLILFFSQTPFFLLLLLFSTLFFFPFSDCITTPAVVLNGLMGNASPFHGTFTFHGRWLQIEMGEKSTEKDRGGRRL